MHACKASVHGLIRFPPQAQRAQSPSLATADKCSMSLNRQNCSKGTHDKSTTATVVLSTVWAHVVPAPHYRFFVVCSVVSTAPPASGRTRRGWCCCCAVFPLLHPATITARTSDALHMRSWCSISTSTVPSAHAAGVGAQVSVQMTLYMHNLEALCLACVMVTLTMP